MIRQRSEGVAGKERAALNATLPQLEQRIGVEAGAKRSSVTPRVGVVIGLLLVCAWIGWAIRVCSEHSARQSLGVVIVWPTILAEIGLIFLPSGLPLDSPLDRQVGRA